MKAVVMQGEPGKAHLQLDRPYPALRPGYILVDVKAVALNPTDWKHIDRMNTKGALLGCDFAGVVAETGLGYSKPWKRGDRICGFVHGGNQLQIENGAFAERIAVKADVAMRIPDNMSFEDAATLGVAVVTCGQGLFQKMGLNRPSDQSRKGETILIYGGSSATGMLGIQFAKLAGYTPITTCSPDNFALVKSLGAVEAFDYKNPNCVDSITAYTGGELRYIWDTISSPATARICAQVISPGGTYGTILKIPFERQDVNMTWTLGYTAMGETIEKRGVLTEGKLDNFTFMKEWIEEVEPLLHQGQLKAPPTQVGKGLEGILEAEDLLRQNKVSAKKLVFTVSK
ncbi:hypothetical protein FDECE_8868 [Fusarium decemcellulare]|nr:hypothetical protein FDECE_8868 [Fusarium decemcellulare]